MEMYIAKHRLYKNLSAATLQCISALAWNLVRVEQPVLTKSKDPARMTSLIRILPRMNCLTSSILFIPRMREDVWRGHGVDVT